MLEMPIIEKTPKKQIMFNNPVYVRFKYTCVLIVLFGIYYFFILPIFVIKNPEDFNVKWQIRIHLIPPMVYILIAIIQVKSGLPIYSANKLISKNDESLSACRFIRSLPWKKTDPSAE
jgi:hypothetical protein